MMAPRKAIAGHKFSSLPHKSMTLKRKTPWVCGHMPYNQCINSKRDPTMTEMQPQLSEFVDNIKDSQVLWGLMDKDGEGWVVCDSSIYEETDVMPLWSSEAKAAEHCSEEWATYRPAAIPLVEFLEYWVEDLNNDGVLVGVDWQANEECIELDPIDLAKQLAEIETE